MGPEECDNFCQQPDNMSECLDFTVKMGHMSPEEAERIKSNPMLPPGAPTPGDCKGEECVNYCSDENNFEECMKFADEHHIMDEKAKQHFEKDLPGMFNKPYDPNQPGPDLMPYDPNQPGFEQGPWDNQHGEDNKPWPKPEWSEQEKQDLDHWGNEEFGDDWQTKKQEFQDSTGGDWNQDTEDFKKWVKPEGDNWQSEENNKEW